METVHQLPQDIVVNILSRLPVKYLIQLKCVCKSWQSLISDPHFAKLQLAQSEKNNNLNCHRFLFITVPLGSVDCEDSGDDHDLDHVNHHEYPAIMKKTPGFDKLVGHLEIGGSCNGLICVVFLNGCIFLWNPTIREALELNSGDFDPKGYYIYGLGYDISTDNYKVVRARNHFTSANYSDKSEVEIVALKSNIWRRIEERGFLLHEGPGIFLLGAMHWLAIRASDPKKIRVIVAFDMAEEKFYELVQLPDNIEESKHHRRMVLTISGDSLWLFCGGGYSNPALEVWQLNDYGVKSSWTRFFSENRCTIPDVRYWGNAFYYTKSSKIAFEYVGMDLVWYDLKENTWKTFTPQNDRIWFRLAMYVESLILSDWYRPTVA